jgi:hypothetical protein
MLAIGLVGLVAVALAVAPALVAWRLFAFPAAWVGVVLGGLGATLTGVKLIAMACAFGARLAAPRWAGPAASHLE